MTASPSKPPVIEAVGLEKIFYDFWYRPKAKAVNCIDFVVEQGKVVGFLGPNGSGKSTTVKMILGLLRPTHGSLKVFGASPQDVNTKRRIGYLPEETYLYKYLTAEETLDFFASLFSYPAHIRRERTVELLKMLGMEGNAKRPVGEFSKGMARRIGLAQALINDPDLIILDEPTSGLDPIGCREIKDIIRILAQRGKTVLLCSHLLADVEDICDEIYVLYGGRIRAHGPINQLLEIQDKWKIILPHLDEATIQNIMAAIYKEVPSKQQVTLEKPRKSLEEFFLEVIEQARKEQLTTAGADIGSGIATFLQNASSEEEAESRMKSEAIRQLLQQQELPASGGAEEEPQPAEAESPQPDLEKLRQLSEEPEAPPPPSPSRQRSLELSEEEKKQKSQVIQSLLEQEKKDPSRDKRDG